MSSTATGIPLASEVNKHVLAAPFDSDDADIVIQSSDKVKFPVHRFLLSRASTVFGAMLSLPQSDTPSPTATQGPPVVELPEDRQTLDIVLRLCYPIEVRLPDGFIEHAQLVLEAARKYALDSVMERLDFQMKEERIVSVQPLRVYALACSYGLEDLARRAAKETLKEDPLDVPYSSTLRCMTGGAYHRLLQYHRECGRVAAAAVNEENVTAWAGLPNFSSSVLFLRTKTCHVPIWVNTPLGHIIRSVLRQYLWDLRDAVAVTPDANIALRRSLLQGVMRSVSSCAHCAGDMYSDITKFGDMLKSNMEEKISQVSLVFEQ
ncbi:hypothetical protein CERSUDRAFT_137612 [Gelatoporia subvermispora B]|uniref:BTB domain-containing protein n=1 Tax=Ceriporiopsis subvermispora (strain B) TaxID=914234 RepID=M2QJ99_CERS8|nr:hypothetical protein CERSUDRAFT_137612 [Gelatoporia subvermispora B]